MKYGPRNYQVQIGDQTHKHHVDQLRGRQTKLETEEGEVRPDDFTLFSASSTSSAKTQKEQDTLKEIEDLQID